MRIALFLAALLFALPAAAQAGADLELRSTHTRFSTDEFIVGEEVRVYATVRNVGDVDTTGYVVFYNGTSLLGKSQLVTVVADGNDEEVWTDFIVPSDSFNLYIQIDSTSPEDTDTSNNGYLTPLYTPIYDQDEDGVEDDQDNCPSDANASQTDSDGDGIGDVCDDDDDNDGIDDDVEEELGTDPTDEDTDEDGVNDAQDAFPTDDERSEEEMVLEPEQEEEVVEESQEEDSSESEPAEDVPVEDVEEETVSVDTPLIERASGSVLNVSPESSFVFVQRDWKTYEFEALAHEGTYDSLRWEFGDGTTSVQRTISHSFLKAGRYEVTLSVVDAEGNEFVDTQEINISLFHLANPMIQMTLGILLVLLILSTLALKKTQQPLSSTSTKVVSAQPKSVAPVKKKTTRKPAKKKTPAKKRTTTKKKAAPKKRTTRKKSTAKSE